MNGTEKEDKPYDDDHYTSVDGAQTYSCSFLYRHPVGRRQAREERGSKGLPFHVVKSMVEL